MTIAFQLTVFGLMAILSILPISLSITSLLILILSQETENIVFSVTLLWIGLVFPSQEISCNLVRASN